jgi:uncharacterized metal-binding protein YceD (DUF177 family)
MDAPAPIQRIYNLADLSEAGYEKRVTATPDELKRIAEREGVEAVTAFDARMTLKRLAQKRFSYEAELSADVLQSCVVTLEPLQTHIVLSISRTLHYIPGRYDEKGGMVSLSADDEDGPEEIDSLKYDLAGPLLEEFALALDPYPRTPGVEFELPQEEAAKPENPFAILKALKEG